MECPDYGAGVAFDAPGFWREANRALADGIRGMLGNARNKESLLLAFDEMDYRLGEIVERWDPPEGIRLALSRKLDDAMKLAGKIMNAKNVSTEHYWEIDARCANMVLKALGRSGGNIVYMDKIVPNAISALCEGNFTEEGAHKLLIHISTLGCKNLKDLISKMEDCPNQMEFLNFLVKNGTKGTIALAQQAIDRMAPCEIKAVARKPRLRLVQPLEVVPLRPHPLPRHF